MYNKSQGLNLKILCLEGLNLDTRFFRNIEDEKMIWQGLLENSTLSTGQIRIT